MDPEDPETPRPVRRSAGLAAAASALLLLSLPLPWWRVANDLGGVTTSESVWLWGGGAGLARPEAVLATSVLAVLPLPWLFVRLAGRSWAHEPPSWRRDLGLCALLVAAALAACWLWPVEGWFWGARSYPVEGGGGLEVSQAPAAGWWTAALSALLMAWAWRQSGRKG